MKCIIDKSILYNINKGKSPAVIRRYIRMKYRVNIDLSALKKRMNDLEKLRRSQPGLVGN